MLIGALRVYAGLSLRTTPTQRTCAARSRHGRYTDFVKSRRSPAVEQGRRRYEPFGSRDFCHMGVLADSHATEFLAKHPRSSWATGTAQLPFPELEEYSAWSLL